MSDKTGSDIPENTTSALSHLAFCALAALGLARQDGATGTPYAENLFIIRWLATAQKQRRFPRSVAIDIQWLLERGRKHGAAGKLHQHLEYLWRSCSGDLAAQSDLFRLTYATETLKDQGWDNYVMDNREWKSGVTPAPARDNGFYVEKAALNAAFTQDARIIPPMLSLSVSAGTWRMDETYIRVRGQWKYLYRAVDTAGQTIDFLLTAKRDTAAALRFFRKAIRHHGEPEVVTIDKSGANTAALAERNTGKEADDCIKVRQNKYLNNLVEQDHRNIKRRIRQMLGFKSFRRAQAVLAGIELVHMIRKGQYAHPDGDGLSPAEQFYLLAA